MPNALRRPALAAALVLATALPAAAFDPAAMSDAEREAFRAEVRAYLLENPEVLFEAVAVFEERQAAAQAGADAEMVAMNAQALYDDGFSWVGGNPDGDVTLVEFLDYSCTFCRRAFDEVMGLIEDDGNIRFVVKELPILGPQSELASRFAIAVHQVGGDDAYLAVHVALMSFPGDYTAATLRRIGEQVIAGGTAFDLDAAMLRMDSPDVSRVINENRLLAQRLAVNGTPTFVIADEMIRGFVPRDAMEQLVAEVRAR